MTKRPARLTYVVLCELAGEVFPVAVVGQHAAAEDLAARLQHEAVQMAVRPEQYGPAGRWRPGSTETPRFRVAEAPLVDVQSEVDHILLGMETRRAIKLGGNL